MMLYRWAFAYIVSTIPIIIIIIMCSSGVEALASIPKRSPRALRFDEKLNGNEKNEIKNGLTLSQ